MTNNDNSAPITHRRPGHGAARGEAFVMARFETHTVGNQVLVLPKGLAVHAAATSPAITSTSWSARSSTKLRILPSELCSDEDFFRRATIDITGLLPTEAEYPAFMADASTRQAGQAGRRLLERKEFSEIWAMKWAELLDDQVDQPGQPQVGVPLLQLADRPDRQERAARQDGAGAAFGAAAARSRTRRRITTRSSATR